MTKLVIHRSEWYRGRGDRDSALRPSAVPDMYCCLGLYCRDVLHIQKDALFNIATPIGLARQYPEYSILLEGLVYPDYFDDNGLSSLSIELMTLNDTTSLDDLKRENELKLAFYRLGVEVEFED